MNSPVAPASVASAARVSAAAWLPTTSTPPHDPRRLPLNHRSGWHLAYSEHVVEDECGRLQMETSPAALRLLSESSGSFGGLVAPQALALNSPGDIFLLDKKNALLKKFDRCECRFVSVPCTGGVGRAPRQFQDARALAICGDNLLVADKGNRRVAVYGILGFVLRAFWQPPSAALTQDWQPQALAIAHNRRALVGDPANGCVHIFNFAGRWLGKIDGVGAVEALAVDRDNHLYVSQGSGLPISVYDLSNNKRVAMYAEDALLNQPLAENFPRLPFVSDAEGNVDLSRPCACYHGRDPQSAEAMWFSPGGVPIKKSSRNADKQFATQGLLYSGVLDSRFYRCQWDRFIVDADIPKGTRIRVSTFCAETELSAAEIRLLPESQWRTRQWILPDTLQKSAEGGAWDCLILSEPGRYLWFRLEFLSDGFSTPHLCNIELNYPRISLRRYLPNVFGEEHSAADFSDRFLAIFDRGFRQIEAHTDGFAEYLDPLSAPAQAGKRDFLSWLASWIGVSLDRQLPLPLRRTLVKNSGKLFRCRGTLKGLRAMLDLLLGFDRRGCEPVASPACGHCSTSAEPSWRPPSLILEHFKLRRWMFLGAGRLGDQALLWGKKIVNRSQLNGDHFEGNAQLGVTQLNTRQDPLRDPFYVYAHKFSVFLPAWVGRINAYQKAIARMVAAEKPAHTEHHIIYVEPRFRVGIQSMIGFDSVIGCYPQGVTLGESRLGKASVLSETDKNDSGTRLGSTSTIGTTTQLK